VKFRHESVTSFRIHAAMKRSTLAGVIRLLGWIGAGAVTAMLAVALIALPQVNPLVAHDPGDDAQDTPIEIRSTGVRFNVENRAQSGVDKLRFLGGIRLSSHDPRFGGLSGLLLTEGGARLYAVSDRAYWLEADVLHDADEKLVGVANARMGALRGLNGKPMEFDRDTDSEGLAILDNGDWLVSFERAHRFRRYPAGARPLTGQPVKLPPPPGIKSAPGNGGMEALVTLRDGRLVAFTEELLADDGEARVVYLWDGSDWEQLQLKPFADYKPTGASLLPDGDVILLERRWDPIGGLGIRVSRIATDSIVPGAHLVPEQLALMRRPMTIDNLEGIAARSAADGRTLIYMISDDNYRSYLQDTLLLQFELTE
jgi:hypothetical protein